MASDTNKSDLNDSSDSGFALRITLGLALVILLLFGVGGWAAVSPISGAVIAPGSIVVEGSLKKVQHHQGGVVGAILVKTGDRVQAGDLLLKLDETQTRANLAIIRSQLTEFAGRKSRLTAERDGATAIKFPDGFETSHDDAPGIVAGEQKLFNARNNATQSQRSQLGKRLLGLKRKRKPKKVKLSWFARNWNALKIFIAASSCPSPASFRFAVTPRASSVSAMP
jgi:HlyD family secretion protein